MGGICIHKLLSERQKEPVCITLGSLFDGIGAFPYAASFFGIKTLWASEILPNAVSITKRHFPDIQHLGNILELNGSDIPPVDIITLGSPCQSWSIAGDRTGLDGKSGLFMEGIRIIREMRKATNGHKPQIALFENVVGLLHCRAGGRSDYKTVLEAFCETEIPMPESGKWANAGMVRGRGINLAWIVKDASKHFRVPQRRKRLFLVCDFSGQRASKILFVSQSLSGYFAARESERERTAANAENGVGSTSERITTAGGNDVKSDDTAVTVINDQGGSSISIEKGEISPTLRSQAHGNLPIVCAAFMAGQSKTARSIAYSETVSPTLKGSPSGLNMMPCICEPKEQTAYGICSKSSYSMLSDNPQSGIYEAKTSRTLDRNCGNLSNNQGGLAIVEPLCSCLPQSFTMRMREGIAGGGKGPLLQAEKSGTLATGNDQYLFCPSYSLQGNMLGRQNHNGPQGSGINEEICFTLSAADRHAVATLDCRNLNESDISGTLQSKSSGGYSLNYVNPVRVGYIVRRLTPTEAERLMSLPDGYTEYGHDGKLISDSARYQLIGNSIVINCLAYIMQNIAEELS